MQIYVLIGIYMAAALPLWLTPIAAVKEYIVKSFRTAQPEDTLALALAAAPAPAAAPAKERALVAVS